MSITTFLKMPDVAAKIKLLRPRLPRAIPGLLKVPPRTKNYMLVGTAFDYLLRFELQRRAPHAVGDKWVADGVPDRLRRFDLLYDRVTDWADYMVPAEVEKRARENLEKARAAVSAYVKLKEPNRSGQADLAAHAIRLAKLDSVARALRLEPHFEDADPTDVEDLLALLGIVPWGRLIDRQTMLLNPTFGEASATVGGADADLITGDMLVEFKATKAKDMQGVDLDQLLGYYLLARRHAQSNPAFPVVNRLAMYFCRHGSPWVEDATTWTSHPQFSEIEEWFFQRADEVFGQRTRRPQIRLS